MVDCAEPTYLPASWKGVPFNVEQSADEFGRRGDLYEYPLSEDVGYKDLGRKARRFRIQGYLIGSAQVALTNAMARAAESREPGMLVHPIYGTQMCACITLTTTADYRKDKKRTKLAFDFVEATASMAPYMFGGSPTQIFDLGSSAVDASTANAVWEPLGGNTQFAGDVQNNLSTYVAPATDEASFDAIDYLNNGTLTVPTNLPSGAFSASSLRALRNVAAEPTTVSSGGTGFPTFASAFDPINYGTATIRRIHDDTLRRLREFNKYVVDRGRQATNASAQALIVSTRLAMIRDYAVKASETTYPTIKDALDDLDFVMKVYDEEEAAVTARCDDPAITAIRRARAASASQILAANITLPGIVEINVDGVWPSLVAAHKYHRDGSKYLMVEQYNPQMSPFWIGRDIVTPARTAETF